jgi:cell division septal protein FtsQ
MVARRPALAAARAQPIRPALVLPRLRLPLGRTLASVGILAGALALGYLAARSTSLFALHSVAVSGAGGAVEADVRTALRPLNGESLVTVDAERIEQQLSALPSVWAAHVDRAFPHGLRVAVVPERPVALLRSGGSGWIVSERGRVIRAAAPETSRRLPRIWLAAGAAFEPGEKLALPAAAKALRVIALLPARFPVPVLTARATEEGLVMVLSIGLEVRLGSTDHLDAKLASAAAVLRGLSSSERGELDYVDVSLPERPVGGTNPQVDS